MLSERLKKLREEKNLLQKDVASAIGITTSAYGFYEQGKRQPDLNTLEQLANFFNVSSDYLLGRTNVRQQPEILAAHRTDNYDDPLPQEALEELERFKAYIRHKYRHWKPGMTQSEYLKKYGGDGKED